MALKFPQVPRALRRACIVLGALFLLSGCFTPAAPPPDNFTDLYTAGGPQVFHVASPGGYTFTYSLDLGSATRDVYFVFTNPSASERANPAVQNPSLARGLEPAAGPARERGAVSTAGVAFRGRPEATAFNENPSAYVPLRPPARGFVPPPPAPLLDSVNDTKPFLTDNGELEPDYGPVPSTCRLVADSDDGLHRLNFWVADDCWDGAIGKANTVTGAMLTELADKFLSATSSEDIYHWVTGIYGPEWGPHSYSSSLVAPAGASDRQELTILLYDIADDDDAFLADGGAAGFFWAKDNYLNSPPEFEYSNERVMFYIDAVMFAEADGVGWDLTDYWPSEIVATLAHEFQHMIHFYQKLVRRTGLSGTETWINEMLSMCTEDIVANKIEVDGPRGVPYSDYTAGASENLAGRLPLYNYYDDYQLTYWPADPLDLKALLSYSINYAFGAFLTRTYTGAAGGSAEFLRNVMQNGYTNYRALEYAAAQAGSADSFGLMMQKWGAANLLSDDDSTAPPGYAYNTGTSVDSTFDTVPYRLGSINLYNYRYWYDTGPSDYLDGPYIYPTGGGEIGDVDGHLPASNLYYEVGTGLTGLVEREVYMGSGVRLTVVVK